MEVNNDWLVLASTAVNLHPTNHLVVLRLTYVFYTGFYVRESNPGKTQIKLINNFVT